MTGLVVPGGSPQARNIIDPILDGPAAEYGTQEIYDKFTNFGGSSGDEPVGRASALDAEVKRLNAEGDDLDRKIKDAEGQEDDGSRTRSFGEIYAAVMRLLKVQQGLYGAMAEQATRTAEEQVKQIKQYTAAKSALTKLLGKLLPGKDEDNPNPKLADKITAEDPAYKALNAALKELGRPEIDLNYTKSDLEGLQADLSGSSDALVTEQGMKSSEINQILGKFQASETMVSNIVKAQGSLEMTVARNSGPL
ncbi:hypothetical protein [Bordetella flabilis]|uniref:Uncharacterized protein n=1 Tax=Bordetella flabilis TaxID=463014 RepID=A0A193G9V0_9BORD|nr:hypothetical protein [Bordetella flabilis]ANN76762.1 hypothetical protein BAU07_06230 [Bordetella flabilis]